MRGDRVLNVMVVFQHAVDTKPMVLPIDKVQHLLYLLTQTLEIHGYAVHARIKNLVV